MALRKIAIFTLALLAWSAGAFALVDPGGGESGPVTPIQPSVDAGSAAVNALSATGTRDVRVVVTYENESTTLERLLVRYEVSDGEFAAVRNPGQVRLYGTTGEAWQLATAADAWIHRRSEWNPGGPFHHHALVASEMADLQVEVRNESTLTVLIQDTDTAYAVMTGVQEITAEEEDIEASLRMRIDMSSGLMREMVYTVKRGTDGEDRRVRRTVYRFSQWDETTVARPLGVPYTLPELLEDVGRVR